MASVTAGSLVVRSKRTRKLTARGPPAKRRRLALRPFAHQEIFPFLDLPAELRNVIYSLCITMGGIATYLKEFLERYKNCVRPKQIRPKATHRTTPTVLLINRQIYAEVVGYVEQMALVFAHGIFTNLELTSLICAPALQRVRSITITGDIEEITDPLYGVQSWFGYVHLFSQLASCLKDKHQLRELNIDFPKCEHTDRCWQGSWGCGFRDRIRKALKKMRDIRGVSKVRITGLPEDITRELTHRMTTAPIGFLDLPRELRDMIYDHVVGEWPDVSGGLNNLMQNWSPRTFTQPPYPELRTPSIFRVNRFISEEALARRDLVFQKPLTIDFPTQFDLQHISVVPNIMGFLPTRIMQRVKHLTLNIPSWQWTHAVPDLVAALGQRHSLETLTIKFKDQYKTFYVNGIGPHYPDKSLHQTIGHFARLNGVGQVSFEGDLPSCYTAPLQAIMQGTHAERKVPIIYAESLNHGKLFVLPTPWL